MTTTGRCRRRGGHWTICSKLHVKQKAQRNQRLSNTVVCAWIALERQIPGIFLSKPSFRTDSRGNGHLKGPLACDFGRIVW